MKLAIISITDTGKNVAIELFNTVEMDPSFLKVDLYHKNVKKTLNKIFYEYDCILGVMATGIMVRSICHLFEDKTKDPAVLVMDEKSKHIISLLSGHLGGANDLALKIADITGADPVITTATDVNGKIGIDMLAYRYYLEIEDPSIIRGVNKALINKDDVLLAVPPRFEFIFQDNLVKNSYRKGSSHDEIEVTYKDTSTKLHPKKVVVGIGSRRGVSTDSVLLAVNEACKSLGIFKERIDIMATAEPKMKEKGIIGAAEKMEIKLEVVSLDRLKDFNYPQMSKSPLVMEKFGVPGICEPAALITAGNNSTLIHRKKVINKVTVAVAVSAI
jgi:cobalt-precorrin 5A hydrolase